MLAFAMPGAGSLLADHQTIAAAMVEPPPETVAIGSHYIAVIYPEEIGR